MKVFVTNVIIGELSVISLMLLFIRKIPSEDLNFADYESNAITESVEIYLGHTNSMVPSINGTKLIEKHLKAIRNQYPMFEDVEYCGNWLVSELLVSDFTKISVNDCVALINDTDYGPVSIEQLYPDMEIDRNFHVFKFHTIFNPEKLAPIISHLCGVQADPNHLTCIGANYLQLDGLSETESRYTFSKGSGDCPSGCLYEHFWQFLVTPNGVTLENEWERGEKSLEGLD